MLFVVLGLLAKQLPIWPNCPKCAQTTDRPKRHGTGVGQEKMRLAAFDGSSP